MKVEVLPRPEALAERAAATIAAYIRTGVQERGRFVLALSGGTEPWAAFRRLALLDLPWHALHVVQVDERVAPAGDPVRNWTHLQASLLERAPIPPAQIHPMPVEDEPLAAAAERYAALLEKIAGRPAVIDLVHLGLGTDGHTASLVPGDPLLESGDVDVGITAGEYQGMRRMTLTYPVIDRARAIFWLVAGPGKGAALQALIAGDPRIPAGRVRQENAFLLTDQRTLGTE
jgi:6-phosphogluconolactonase